MKHLTHILSGAALAATLILAPVAKAQPDPNNAPKADNPDNRAPRANRPQLTPEERQARRDEQRKQFMKRQLERVGVTDEAQQTAVTQYIEGETKASQDLQESGRALGQALRADAISDTQVAALLNTYNVAIDDDRARRKAAQKKLGESVDLLKAPRLEAYLTLMGLYGDGPRAGNFGGGNNRGGRGG